METVETKVKFDIKGVLLGFFKGQTKEQIEKQKMREELEKTTDNNLIYIMEKSYYIPKIQETEETEETKKNKKLENPYKTQQLDKKISKKIEEKGRDEGR